MQGGWQRVSDVSLGREKPSKSRNPTQCGLEVGGSLWVTMDSADTYLGKFAVHSVQHGLCL